MINNQWEKLVLVINLFAGSFVMIFNMYPVMICLSIIFSTKLEDRKNNIESTIM